MTAATVRDARATHDSSETDYEILKADYAALEPTIYDLMRLLRAAAHLQENDEDLRSSAKLIVDLAAKKADELNEQYHRTWPGEGINSRIEEGV